MKLVTNITKTLFFLFILISTASASNVGDTFGMSPEGMSLGNAVSARVNDWSSPYYNIAGLGKTAGLEQGKNQIGLAYISSIPSFDIDIDRTGVPGDSDLETGSFVIGGVLDTGLLLELPSFVSSARVGILLAVNDDFSAVAINDLDPRSHNFMRFGRECQRLVVMGGLGLGFLDDTFGFGFGVNSAFGGDGNVAMLDVQLETDPQTPKGQAKMNMDIEQNLIFGAYYRPLAGLDLGLSYKQETELKIYPFNTVATTEVGGIDLNLILALVDYYYPETITLGSAYTLGEFTVSFDLELQNWSGFEMSPPMTINFGSEFKKFDDIIVPKLGLQYQMDSSVDLLFGYYYQPSFVPDDALTGLLNSLDNDKHVLSCGFTWKVPEVSFIKADMELSGGYQLQALMERDVTKTSPTALNPNYSFGGTCHSLMFGITLTL